MGKKGKETLYTTSIMLWTKFLQSKEETQKFSRGEKKDLIIKIMDCSPSQLEANFIQRISVTTTKRNSKFHTHHPPI